MGSHQNIGHERFPRQGRFLHRRVKVCFNYDTANTVMGTVVRDDAEDPFIELIRLDDGRYVLTTECQYTPVAERGDAA